jgi:hypothetical protein
MKRTLKVFNLELFVIVWSPTKMLVVKVANYQEFKHVRRKSKAEQATLDNKPDF